MTHHKKDACKVTQSRHTKKNYNDFQAPEKDIILSNGGVPTGKKCGPFHHLGYVNIEEAAKKIIKWMKSNTDK